MIPSGSQKTAWPGQAAYEAPPPNISSRSAATNFARRLLLTESGTNCTWPDFQRIVMTRWRFFALFAVVFAVGGWLTARTWRQVWRTGRSQWERLVYDYGVRGCGFSTAVGLTAIITWLGWATDSAGLFGPTMTGGLLAGLFFGTPVALRLGYFLGAAFAALTGVEHDHRVEVGEPPHLT